MGKPRVSCYFDWRYILQVLLVCCYCCELLLCATSDDITGITYSITSYKSVEDWLVTGHETF